METADIVAIKQGIEAEWLGRPGIRGIDVGYKIRGGELKRREICIRFFVEQKDAHEPEDEIPPEINGIFTDVIEVGVVKATAADSGRYRPLAGSISVSVESGTSGTLGGIVSDRVTRALMGLSASHVFAGDDNLSQAIVQPSHFDGGRTANGDRIANVTTRNSRIGGTSGAGGVVGQDCAVATILDGVEVTNTIVGIGPLNGTSTVTLGDSVKKRGRSTLLTFGEVTGIDATVVVDYADTIPTTTYYHQISVGVAEPSVILQAGGDSGALLLNLTNEAVGLLYASDVDEMTAWATPIATVLNALGVDFVLSEALENRSVISWNNHLTRIGATFSASSEVSTMGIANIILPHLAIPWRTSTGNPQWVACDIGATREISVVGLFGTNFTPAGLWRVRLSNISAGLGDVWDSGQMAANVFEGYRQTVYVLPGPVEARYVQIDFEDEGVRGGDEFFDIGLVWVGDAWQPSLNFAMGYSDGWIDNSVVTKSRGGQAYTDKRARYRVRQLVYDMIDEVEVLEQASEMERLAGVTDNLLFIPEPFSTDTINATALLGRLVQLSPAQMVGLRRWQKAIAIEERL